MLIDRLPPDGEITPDALVVAWIAHDESRGGLRVQAWAWDHLDCLVHHDPETAWPIIVKLVACSPSNRTLANIAAGPLEDLLNKYGVQFVGRVAALAIEDARFRKCLRGVWLSNSSESDETWRVIQAVIGHEPSW